VSRALLAVFAIAVALYLPTVRYGYVQDDRAVIVANPSAHSVGAAVQGFGRPYWPGVGFYRPFTVLTFAVDWAIAGGRPWWLHLMNAVWHGLACVLLVLVFARWLPRPAAILVGLVFALHPVHVEGVANLVSRSESLAMVGMLAAILAARRRWWIPALCCALLAMLSKERGVITGAVMLLDHWLRPTDEPPYPAWFIAAIGAVTLGYLALWLQIGRAATSEITAPLLGAGLQRRLAMALPAIWRAGILLVWPVSLSASYDPQVIPYRTGWSVPALLGALLAGVLLWIVFRPGRRSPATRFAAAVAILAYLPTANLLFPSGIILSERDLYQPVILPAALVGTAAAWAMIRWNPRRIVLAGILLCTALAARSLTRVPAWQDNRTFLLALLAEHPESYKGQLSAAAVLSGIDDVAGARAAYRRADSLFDRDAHLKAAYAYFEILHGDTARAAVLSRDARRLRSRERIALRVEFLLARSRSQPERARALADSARGWFPEDTAWYAAVRP
jgi:protein O-mannosyl-transferase